MKNWKKQFKQEFGIHFENSKDELEFAIVFIEDLLKENKPTGNYSEIGSKSDGWEKEFDKKFGQESILDMDWSVDDLKQFISDLLKVEKEKIAETIVQDMMKSKMEKFAQERKQLLKQILEIVGKIKKPKWLERDFKNVPNKRGIWYAGFSQFKQEIREGIKKLKDK